MFVPSVPVHFDSIPFEGAGPSNGIGTQENEVAYGMQVMVSGPPSILPTALLMAPTPLHAVDLSGVPLYPGSATVVGMAPATYAPLTAPLQDSMTAPAPIGDIYSLPLGAPPIPTGNANFVGRGF